MSISEDKFNLHAREIFQHDNINLTYSVYIVVISYSLSWNGLSDLAIVALALYIINLTSFCSATGGDGEDRAKEQRLLFTKGSIGLSWMLSAV